jgi:hypothetical protein
VHGFAEVVELKRVISQVTILGMEDSSDDPSRHEALSRRLTTSQPGAQRENNSAENEDTESGHSVPGPPAKRQKSTNSETTGSRTRRGNGSFEFLVIREGRTWYACCPQKRAEKNTSRARDHMLACFNFAQKYPDGRAMMIERKYVERAVNVADASTSNGRPISRQTGRSDMTPAGSIAQYFSVVSAEKKERLD